MLILAEWWVFSEKIPFGDVKAHALRIHHMGQRKFHKYILQKDTVSHSISTLASHTRLDVSWHISRLSECKVTYFGRYIPFSTIPDRNSGPQTNSVEDMSKILERYTRCGQLWSRSINLQHTPDLRPPSGVL